MSVARNYEEELAALASLYGVQTSYRDQLGQRRRASPPAVLSALNALEAPVERWEDLPGALRQCRQEVWRSLTEPVLVAWGGRAPTIELRLAASAARGALECRLDLEGEGGDRSWSVDLEAMPELRHAEVEAVDYVIKGLELPDRLPFGYHYLRLETGGREEVVLVISAPAQTFVGPRAGAVGAVPLDEEKARDGSSPAHHQWPEEGTLDWGVFLPLYALHSKKSWGVGDFGDLEALLDWVAGLGGNVVATLPLSATFLEEPFEPSPYAPVSRLFWNELFLDVDSSPDLEACPEAREALRSEAFRREIQALQATDLVDYRRAMAVKRRILELLARSFFSRPSRRLEAFQSFLLATPALQDYALFRAACERYRSAWPAWPSPARDGELSESDVSADVVRYHLYVQWLASEQLQAVPRKSREAGAGLLLDMPLGVHRGGYDTWREREAFALRASVGAPPDDLNPNGQGWGLPPLHPQRIRSQGYRYPIACVRHQLHYARVLRIDHVMGLHRLFWIPEGQDPTGGVYVRYQADELYAILALESQRSGTLIVGEDLGTVPNYVRQAMARHRVNRIYVLQLFGLDPDPVRAPTAVPANSLASLNTHDTPPFAAFWQGRDIDERLSMGLLDERSAQIERQEREALKKSWVASLQGLGHLPDSTTASSEDQAAEADVLKGCLEYLSVSDARMIIANLEDLWGETGSQNVPGTGQEQHPNWRRRARYSFEEFRKRASVAGVLQEIDRDRRLGS